jgi:hypothetical protein
MTGAEVLKLDHLAALLKRYEPHDDWSEGRALDWLITVMNQSSAG